MCTQKHSSSVQLVYSSTLYLYMNLYVTSALIPALMAINIVTPESGAQLTEAVKQVAPAADSIGNSIRELPPSTTPQADTQVTPRGGGLRGFNGGEAEGEEEGGSKLVLEAIKIRVEGV